MALNETTNVYVRLGYLERSLICHTKKYEVIRDYFRKNYSQDDFLKEKDSLFKDYPELFARLKRSFKMDENLDKKFSKLDD